MEQRHEQFILRNLGKLVKLTDCNVLVLVHLQSRGVISEEEYEELQAIPTRLSRASKLYKIALRKKNSYLILHQALNETLQTGAAEVLLEGLDAIFDPSELTSYSEPGEEIRDKIEKKRVLFDVQDPSSLFIGREKELEDLDTLLNLSSRLAVITHIASVSGLGGVGKTQLARKYAQDCKIHYDNNVIWINAESEESATSSFLKLASDRLDITTKNVNGKEKEISIVVQDCYAYFQTMRCLFIFDNAENEKYLQQFLPSKTTSQTIYMLITSRHQDWDRSAQVLGLNVFSEEEAITFVKEGLEIEDDLFKDDIKLLVNRLQYFPLAISQAISYIYNQEKMGDYSVMDYIKEFEISSGHLLDYNMSSALESNYTKTTFTTWKMTIDKIAQTPEYGDLAVKIFNIVAYFSPDDIYRDTFYKLGDYTNDTVKQAVNLLVKYSMVVAKDKQSIFSIHRLVQEVVRINLRRLGKENETIDMALILGGKCLCEKFLPHAISAWNYAKSIPELISKYAPLASKIMDTLKSSGRYNEACQFGENTLEVFKSSGVAKLTILEFEKELGDLFIYTGKYEASLYHLEHVEKECKSMGNNPLLLSIQQCLAWTLYHQRKIAESLELSLKVCENCKLTLGEGHPLTSSSLLTTAAVAWRFGEYDLSHSTFIEGFRCFELGAEKNEIDYLKARHNFALLIADRGDIIEALAILKGIHAKIMASPELKVTFRLRISTLRSICIYLNETGSYMEAHEILVGLYEEQKSVLGEDDEDTLNTLNEIGTSLVGMKRYEEAYSACHAAYLKQEKNSGEDSHLALDALRMCAIVHSHQGHHDTAILLIVRVVTGFERAMGIHNVVVLKSKYAYARILARGSRGEKALAVLEELEESYLKVFGKGNRDYLRCGEFIDRIKLGGRELEDWLEA